MNEHIDWVAISKVGLGVCEFKMCMCNYVNFTACEYEREALLRDDDPDLL